MIAATLSPTESSDSTSKAPSRASAAAGFATFRPAPNPLALIGPAHRHRLLWWPVSGSPRAPVAASHIRTVLAVSLGGSAIGGGRGRGGSAAVFALAPAGGSAGGSLPL